MDVSEIKIRNTIEPFKNEDISEIGIRPSIHQTSNKLYCEDSKIE
jgi:hypothetical protein